MPAVVAFSLFAVSASALAQTRAPEPDLKAAIISNMLLFVEWPVRNLSPADELTICYYGNGPVVAALIRLDGKNIKGKSLKVVAVPSGNPAQCRALYIAPGNAEAFGAMRGAVGASSIFTAADSPEYFPRGAMLNLDVADGRIVFDVDLRSAQKAGLAVSSKALRLAREVIE